MICDIGKAVIPGVISRFVFHDNGVAAVGAGAAVVGHIWPVFAGFRGGRGVASAFGAVLGLTPVAFVFPLIGAALVIPTRYVSLMSVVGTPIAALILVVAAAAFGQPWPFAVCALFATALVEYKHIPNIRRLLAGTEPRIGQGGNRPATG